MAQTVFSGLTGTIANLNANFTQLYDLRELISSPSYAASTPKATIDASGNWSFGNTRVTASQAISGNVTVATQIPINTTAQLGGVLIFLRGVDVSGISFARIYLVALRVNAGALPDVSTAVLVSSAGTAVPQFTFSNVGGFLNISATANNISYASIFGG